VKFRTGGIAREPFGRLGEIPRPTVKVWMGEGEIFPREYILWGFFNPEGLTFRIF
jgi:hypothetical protein